MASEPYIAEHGCGCIVLVAGKGQEQQAVMARMCANHKWKVAVTDSGLVSIDVDRRAVWRMFRKSMRRAESA